MGWVEGALAEAADLRGVGDAADRFVRPSGMGDRELLEMCRRSQSPSPRRKSRPAPTSSGWATPIASQISPRSYRQFALPYEQRIFAAVHEMGALARLHICGNTTHILADMARKRRGHHRRGLDGGHGPGRRERSASAVAVCGNQDPVAVMLQRHAGRGAPAVTLACMTAGGARSISTAGCEIPDWHAARQFAGPGCREVAGASAETRSTFTAKQMAVTPAYARPAPPAHGHR